MGNVVSSEEGMFPEVISYTEVTYLGKATERRIKRRQEELLRIKVNNPGRYERELNKRLESWSGEIRFRAREGKIAAAGVFDIARRVKLLGSEAENTLEHEACRALSGLSDGPLYNLICDLKEAA